VAGCERQIAVSGALFENDPRIAELAVLTGEVISFAFEAQVAPHVASGAGAGRRTRRRQSEGAGRGTLVAPTDIVACATIWC
jgi:hypothetical protein